MKLHISIVSPEKTLLEEEADEVTIPTVQGEITVLPEHVNLLSQLAPGELIIRNNAISQHMVVTGGFLEITGNNVLLLADYAVHGKDISAVKAEEAKVRAEKAMKEKLSEKDFAIAEAELRRALLELKVANKLKRSS